MLLNFSQNNALKKYVDGGQDDDYIATLNGYRFLLAIVGEDATRGHVSGGACERKI